MAAARKQTYGRRTPQGRCGVEAGDLKSLAKDDPRAEESNSRDHLGCDARRAGVVRKQPFEDHKARRADRNQRIGPQAGHPLTPLAFEADAGAQKGSHGEADCGLVDRSVHGEFLLDFLTLSAARIPPCSAPFKPLRS
jgi:hypothetical protein